MKKDEIIKKCFQNIQQTEEIEEMELFIGQNRKKINEIEIK